ncbi:MAG: hypothetical protein ABJJ90_15105 [Lentilitoribacter sp.]
MARMRFVFGIFVVFTLCCENSVVSNEVSAQSLSEASQRVTGEAFVRAFLGHCDQNAGDIERVVSAAKSLGYRDLPDEMKPLIAPQDPYAEFDGFIALKGEGAPFFLGVSKAAFNGKPYVTCALGNPYIETAQVVSAL